MQDGHHMSIIEHTLNVLILPGLHTDSRSTENILESSTSLLNASSANSSSNGVGQPSLAMPGLKGLCMPSPLHLRLHVLTRLSFNEQGRITRHRDFWDVRDVLGLVPGMRVAQWLGTRIAAQGIAAVTQAASWVFGGKKSSLSCEEEEVATMGMDVERDGSGGLPATMDTTVSGSSSRGELHDGTGGSGANALGLQLHDGLTIPSGSWKGRSGGGVRVWGPGLYLAPLTTSTTAGTLSSDAPDVDPGDFAGS